MNLGQEFHISSLWGRDDDLAFERALAIYTEKTKNRWEKITAAVPGKTLEQIKEHYEVLVHDVMMIESGCVPLPDYDISGEPNHNFSDKERSNWECGSSRKCEFKQEDKSKLKQKKRKGIPWTSDEHRQFLLGLKKYGKGDWRSISRNCVVTRTPTQVASHAQKYFARLTSMNRNKKRSSIHDITDVEGTSMSTKQTPITRHDTNNNVVSSNIQTASQPSIDLPVYGPSNIWNTQATQTILQPSLGHPTYGAPTIWNTQQPTVNIPQYGTPIISQSMVTPMFLPFGRSMNHLAPSHMAYGVQHHLVPYSSIPNVSLNMGSIPYNMNYLPDSEL